MVAMSAIKHPQKLSVKTALALFDIKVAPVTTYGVQVVWEHLTVNHLWKLERIKAALLKRTLGLPNNVRNRYCYLLAETKAFMEEVRERFNLEKTLHYELFLEEFREKLTKVPLPFFVSYGMTQDSWKGPLCPTRHVITRASVHGFHHLFCGRREFHEPEDDCRCRRCHQPCPLYHSLECPRGTSLTEMASGSWGA